MHNVTLIGKCVKGFKSAFSKKGYKKVTFCDSAKSVAIKSLGDSELFVMDSTAPADKEFLAAIREYPKIYVCAEAVGKLKSAWLRERFAYHLCNPREIDLVNFAWRITRETGYAAQNADLKKTNILINKEVVLFEEINKILVSSRDINNILIAIMKRVKVITGAEAWSILLKDETSQEIIFEKIVEKDKSKKKIKVRPGEGIAGSVAAKGMPMVVPDVAKSSLYSQKIDSAVKVKTKSIICAPLKSTGRIIGVLEVINKINGEPFDQQDLDILMRIVDFASIAVDRMMLHKRLEELVVTDDLTNLFNMRYLNRSIESEIMRCKRYGVSVSLIFLDIDHFKDINDNFGHLVGSKMLVEMGQLLIDLLRVVDIVARYGGDEFVIVLPQTTLHNAMLIAERIRKTVEGQVFMKSEGLNLHITASFGVAAFPESAKSKEALMKLADEAMYSVKNRTRNGVYAII